MNTQGHEVYLDLAVANRGGHPSPGPLKISHKKDGRRRQLHRFHASRPPPQASR